MNNTPYIYDSLDAGRQDLLSFSKMNMNEDRPLYLCVTPGLEGYMIVRTPGTYNINSIALNGQVFLPTAHPIR